MEQNKRYKLTFGPQGKTIEVETDKAPFGDTGLSGSILDIALSNNVDIEHVCGGNIACSTCHVHVQEGLETCPPPTQDELDQLEAAEDRKPESRLSCQCVPNGSKDVVVHIP